MNKNFITVKATIHPETRQDSMIIGKYELTDLNLLPFDSVNEKIYIATCWNSTSYLKAGTDRQYTLMETLGEPLKLGVEYLFLMPKY